MTHWKDPPEKIFVLLNTPEDYKILCHQTTKKHSKTDVVGLLVKFPL